MIFQVDVDICGTAYVRAATKEEALAKLAHKVGGSMFTMEVISTDNAEIEISTVGFDSPRLPEISMSPAMTGYMLTDGKPITAEDFHATE